MQSSSASRSVSARHASAQAVHVCAQSCSAAMHAARSSAANPVGWVVLLSMARAFDTVASCDGGVRPGFVRIAPRAYPAAPDGTRHEWSIGAFVGILSP